jgi:hypothetical protein
VSPPPPAPGSSPAPSSGPGTQPAAPPPPGSSPGSFSSLTSRAPQPTGTYSAASATGTYGAVGGSSSGLLAFTATGRVAQTGPGRVRASRWVVRPGRKNGGTVIVFKLPRAALLRLTVLRVFPTCKLMGSFRIRAHAGVNRVPFRGRVRGRALPAGTYRLIVHAEGAKAHAAEVTIVVVRGKKSAKSLRKARRAAVCGARDTVASTSLTSFDPLPGVGNGGSPGKARSEAPVTAAAKAVVKRAKALGSDFKESLEESGPVGTLFLIVVGLLTLASAALGALVLLKIARLLEIRERFSR